MKVFILSFLLCFSFLLKAQNSYKMKLLSKWSNPNLKTIDNSGSIWNDITGWHDSIKKREYAIAGTGDSIYFFDVSNASQIKLIDVEDGVARNATNRDYETYSHYAYCVSDQGNGALQVFDLQYLPDSVHKVFESDSLGKYTHSLFIEAASKRMYMCSNKFNTPVTFTSAMDIVSLSNPALPTFLARLEVPKNTSNQSIFTAVHEVYVKHDTAYCSAQYEGLFIFDLSNLNKQKLLGVINNYSQAGYNHTNWLNSSGKYIVINDEVPTGLYSKIFDISNLRNPKLVSLFNSSPKATPHNCFWVGNYIYQSSYQDGVYIWNASNPANPEVAAFYDTYPQNDTVNDGSYHGCWGVYPFLPSGNIIASDRNNGIFVLRADANLSASQEYKLPNQIFKVYPNPSNNTLFFNFDDKEECISIKLFSITGEEILFNKNDIAIKKTLYIGELKQGIYFIQYQTEKSTQTVKIIRSAE